MNLKIEMNFSLRNILNEFQPKKHLNEFQPKRYFELILAQEKDSPSPVFGTFQ